MEEDILNNLYQLSCFVGHPVFKNHQTKPNQTIQNMLPNKNIS